MPADAASTEFLRLFQRDIPLLDLRSPVEFARGALPQSTNIPLLSDAQRREIGIAHRLHGGEAALALGHQLVNGAAKRRLVQRWRQFVENNPGARLYCARGGQRSRIARQWLREEGVDAPRVPGGFKALRHFLLSVLEQAAQRDMLVIAGKTGCGKTRLLARLPGALDIEGAARHRGSAFGALPEAQPTQIDFENTLAVALLKLQCESAPELIVEDEGRSIGSLALPNLFFERMRRSPLALIEESLESRIEIILQDYVLSNLTAWQRHFPGRGERELEQSLLASLARIRRRLGGGHFSVAESLMRRAFAATDHTDFSPHRRWIGYLLENYYDPMYEYQLSHKQARVRLRGGREEVARRLGYMSSSAMA